uniref:Uncharacterized protein n=1 Tax=Pipistrellus kuhlii TaxID=59472 RepID=A0A7J7TKM9_PIPKU|nr:hypothetical protein mPipKuh1_009351 [Pipistrellus kuhlii]
MAFLYTNSELTDRETKKAIPFTVVPKKLRYLGINLNKEVEDLYSGNYRTLKKDIKEDIKDGRTYHAHGLVESSSLKCPYYPKQFIDSMHSPLKYQWHIHRPRKNSQKIHLEKKTPNSCSNPEKE